MKQLEFATRLLGFFMIMGASAQASQNSAFPIIGGSNVSSSATIAKRTVALFFIETNGNQGLCTGSILDNSRILTAAHCVSGFKQGLVVFSTANIIDLVSQAAKNGLASVPEVRLMSSAIAQPGYDGQLGGNAEFNDLAIVTFTGGLAAGYEPAHFMTKSTLMSVMTKNAPVTLAGYGITSAPTNTPNPADPDQGSGTLRQVAVGVLGLSPKQIDVYVGGRTGHDACSGDSGGPAMMQANGDWFVIGVASRSDCQTMSIYTLVNQEAVSAAKSNFEMATAL